MKEQQIQRYGRQILLREVGGRGQRKLLSHAVRVEHGSPAISVAVAYLSAGGTPIELADGVQLGGFLANTTLAEFNPDATPADHPWLILTTVALDRPVLQVVVDGAVSWGSCPRCLALNASDAPPPPEVISGSLAALIIQRLALEVGDPGGSVQFLDGVPVLRPPNRCPEHQES